MRANAGTDPARWADEEAGPAGGNRPPSVRIPFVRSCGLGRGEEELPGLLLDLSLKGVYVKTDTLPGKGEILEVAFRVPGNDRQLRLSGLVVWVNREQSHPVHGLPPGFGLRFLALSPEDAVLIQSTIEAYCQSNPMYYQYL
ncbi:MAG: PilZ domain-containing protein [Acidobacteriota bacterium]